MKIQVKYHNDKMDPIKQAHPGEWMDLRAAEDTFIGQGEYKLVSLGVSIKVPDGYECIMAPRSSTFKNYGIIQTNSIGVIDNSYCGDNDIWHFPTFCLIGKDFINGKHGTLLRANERICQFKIVPVQGEIEAEQVETMGCENRGGIGSTGKA